MGWVRISDDFYDHEKFGEVGPLGIAVWLVGMAYCNRNLTNGHIPKSVAGRLLHVEGLGIFTSNFSGRDASVDDGIEEILAAGLWHSSNHDCPHCPQPGRGRYIVHDYLDYQPSKDEVEVSRKRNAFRQAQFKRKNRLESPPPSEDESQVTL